MYSPGRNYPRDASTASSGLSQQTLIIIAACSSVGGVILLFVLFSLFRRIGKSKSVPLPPIQPLAHHREQQLAKTDSRPTTWYDPSYLSAPRHPFPPRGSKVSLLEADITNSSIPSRHASLNVSETTSEDISLSANPLESHTHPSLPQPHPSFHSLGTSSSSLGSSDTDAPASPSPSPSITPGSVTESWLSLDSASTQPFFPRQSRSYSASRSQRRARPLSVGSTASSALSRTSRSTVRGVPHGPHSNIQIILPAPLAEGMPYQNGRSLSHYSPSQSRLSVVDQWASAAVSSSESLDPIPLRNQRRTSSSGTLYISRELSIYIMLITSVLLS